MSKVTIFSVAPLWTPHFETEIEIAKQHLAQGHEVHFVLCDGGLEACIANPDHELTLCIKCRARSRHGLAIAGISEDRIHTFSPSPAARSDAMRSIETIDDLKQYEEHGVDVGAAAASSMISTLRDSHPDIRKQRRLMSRLVSTAVGVFRDADRLLVRLAPDQAYVFNGRTATTRPILRACQQRGVPFKVHEAAYQVGFYRLLEGGLIHDIERNKCAIRATWEDSSVSEAERRRVAAAFFEGRRHGGHGDAIGRYRFASNQTPGVVPIRGESKDKLVVILNSSEDEFASIEGFENPVYRDQMEALERIVRDHRLQNVQFVLRVHPNLSNLDNTQTRRIAALVDVPNLLVIPPTDIADTYSLMEEADAVLTFGSTVGVEALYLGTPSILVGRSWYEDLGCIRPASHDEVVAAVLAENPVPDRDLALRYGYFMMDGATPFQYFSQGADESGSFQGERVTGSRVLRGLLRVIRAPGHLRRDPRRVMSELRQRFRSLAERVLGDSGPAS